MRPLPTAIVSVLQPFACLFTPPTWLHVQVLLAGTLLAHGPRTVTYEARTATWVTWVYARDSQAE